MGVWAYGGSLFPHSHTPRLSIRRAITLDSSRVIGNKYKWLAMLTVGIGTFMSTLDASIVNVSLPTIMASLHTDLPTVQWVVSIYLLVVTGLLLTLGRLADLVGRKPIFVVGMVIFTVGSLFCGLSRHIYALIAFRGLQAIGAAMIMANGPAILTDAFPRAERGKAMGILGMVVATGLTSGPALGGFLIAARGWPLIFFVNLPIGVIGVIMTIRILHSQPRGHEIYFDIPGASMLMVSLASLSLALSDGPEKGWLTPYIIILFGAFLVFGIAFLIRQRTTAHPLINLALFRNRLFAAASASAFVAYVATFSVVFLMPFYLTGLLKYGPEKVGLTLTAVPLTTAVISPISGVLSDRIGSRALGSIGLAIASIGLILISRLGLHPSHLQVIISLVVMGFGQAIFQSPNSSAIMGSVRTNMLGIAAGMVATMRNLGMVTGVAISSAVFTSLSMRYMPEFGPNVGRVLAFRTAFIVAAAICAAGVFTSAAKGSGGSEQQTVNSEQ